MPTYTTNLNLPEYHPATEGSTNFSMEDMLNDPYDKIDAYAGTTTTAVSDLQNRMTTAEGDIDTLQDTVAGHTTDIGNLQTTTTDLQTRTTTVEDKVATMGIEYGTYTGNGALSKTISCANIYPAFIFIQGGVMDTTGWNTTPPQMWLARGMSYGYPLYTTNGGGGITSGNPISGWGQKNIVINGSGASINWNESGTTYYWVAYGPRTSG